MMKWIISITLLALVACSKGPDPTIVSVERGDLVLEVNGSGTLQSARSTTVTPPRVSRVWEYRISYLAPEGKPIEKGTRLLAFDPKEQRERLQIKQAQLLADRKSLEKRQLEEQEKLEQLLLTESEKEVDLAKAKSKLDIPSELQNAADVLKEKKDYELAVAQKEMASIRVKTQKLQMKTTLSTLEQRISYLEREVAEIQTNIDKYTVMAPIDGLVVYRQQRGERPAVGDMVWQGHTLIELPDLSSMLVEAVFDEPDAGRLKEGLDVEIHLDAQPDHVYKGKISKLGKIFRQKSWRKPVTVFDAMIEIEEPNKEVMRPGMTANVRVIIDQLEGVLHIPESAVRYDGKKSFVELASGKLVEVSLGRRSGDRVEILSGLDEGDKLVVSDETQEVTS